MYQFSRSLLREFALDLEFVGRQHSPIFGQERRDDSLSSEDDAAG